ncbi:MAG: hypothetical protein WBZ19_27825 [Chthoniobacterales bacterium]
MAHCETSLGGLNLGQQKEFAKVWFTHRELVLNQPQAKAELNGENQHEALHPDSSGTANKLRFTQSRPL